jgi:DNA-binding HxlR family transcriptional regulator
VAKLAAAQMPGISSANPSAPAGAASTTRRSKVAKAVEPGTVDSTVPHLDRVIHERMRLGIVSALAVNDSLTFNELKKLLQTTDGNLSVHARRLEEAEYVTCLKTFEGRMPKTEYRLTAAGRKAFERYLNHMEALIHAMRER